MLEFAAAALPGLGRGVGLLAASRLDGAPLTPAERELLACVPTVNRVTRPNADLFREGDPTDQLFVLREGWACRYMTNRNGERQITALAMPGDLVNLDAIGSDRPGYGVRLLGRSVVASAPRAQVQALAARHPGIAAALTRLVLIESGMASRWLLCLGRLSARQRVAHLLCELDARLGRGERHDAACFPLPLTQEQMADAVGLTGVHVNRVLRVLRTDGLVQIRGGVVVLADLPRLRAVAEFDPAYLQLHSVVPAGSAAAPESVKVRPMAA